MIFAILFSVLPTLIYCLYIVKLVKDVIRKKPSEIFFILSCEDVILKTPFLGVIVTCYISVDL